MNTRCTRDVKTLAGVLALAALFMAACASTPPPRTELARAERGVQQAEEAGAQQHAALELRSARQRLDSAQGAMGAQDYERARRLAQEADVDAELAERKARAAKAQASVDALRESIRALREEVQRGDSEQ